MDAYAQAKSKLFEISDISIVNIDDPYSSVMLNAASGEKFTYSARRDEADLTAKNIKLGRPEYHSVPLPQEGLRRLLLVYLGCSRYITGLRLSRPPCAWEWGCQRPLKL